MSVGPQQLRIEVPHHQLRYAVYVEQSPVLLGFERVRRSFPRLVEGFEKENGGQVINYSKKLTTQSSPCSLTKTIAPNAKTPCSTRRLHKQASSTYPAFVHLSVPA